MKCFNNHRYLSQSEEKPWHHLYHVFTYIYSLLIKKDICYCRNISFKLLCVYVCLHPEIFHLFGKSFLYLFLFFVQSGYFMNKLGLFTSDISAFYYGDSHYYTSKIITIAVSKVENGIKLLYSSIIPQCSPLKIS